MPPLPTPDEKPHAVRAMFDRIAPRYDRLNRVLTGGRDLGWRRELVRELAVGRGDRVLDLACGTGDFAVIAAGRGAEVVGLDFARRMLELALRRGVPGAAWVQGDALRLPFRDGSFDVALSGFALRNFAAIPPVLAELARVLRPGGRLGLLEVDEPTNRLVRAGHRLYFRRVVPLVGGWLSGDREAYRYLPASTVYLPDAATFSRWLEQAGFGEVRKRAHVLGAIQAVTAVRR